MNPTLDEIRGWLRNSPPWNDWLERSGERPPNYDSLPSIPHLPEPLHFDGMAVAKPEDWPKARAAILATFQRWVIGTYPAPPENMVAEVLSEKTEAAGVRVREMRLRFGPEQTAVLHFELLLPPGHGPFPAFVTQRNHAGWCRTALARGYAAVAYNGCDSADDARGFAAIWPDCDWSLLCRRAWAAGRVLDWLHTQPEMDKTCACIAGHSRNGKLSLICGAIDSRFTAVISSSSGIGGASPYRLANEAQFSEGLDILTEIYPEWFHPRLRFFAGMEHKLPVDANLLLALSAPRAVLISTAYNDPCESVKANERAADSAATVWRLLQAEGKIEILWRPGGHETRTEEIERYLDWCDWHFQRVEPSRRASLRRVFPHVRHFTYDYAVWKKRNSAALKATLAPRPPKNPFPPSTAEWRKNAEDRRRRIRFLLGEEPATTEQTPGQYGVDPPYLSSLLLRPLTGGDSGLEAYKFNFGEYVSACVYLPEGVLKKAETEKRKLPLVIWLPPESVSSGYSAAYFKGRHPPGVTAIDGFAVMAFDSIGNGSRLPEAACFYDRYPRWSLMGKMVRDALAAFRAARQIPWADPERIYFMGFGEGGMTALFAGALEEQVAGAAVVSGFTPLRTDASDCPTGGAARWALWPGDGLLPRLGIYVEKKDALRKIPADFDEILASFAPRPLLYVAPKYDRAANHQDVLTAAQAVATLYRQMDAEQNFLFHAPPDHRRFAKHGSAFQFVHEHLRKFAGL